MRLTMNRRVLGLMLALSLLAGALLFTAPRSADALPNYEVQSNYYTDGTYKTLVGIRIQYCDGDNYEWGIVTAHRKEIYRVVC